MSKLADYYDAYRKAVISAGPGTGIPIYPDPKLTISYYYVAVKGDD